jgi:hypothetical protein
VRLSKEEGPTIKSWLRLVLVSFGSPVGLPGVSSCCGRFDGSLCLVRTCPWFAGTYSWPKFSIKHERMGRKKPLRGQVISRTVADAENRYIEESSQWRDREAERQGAAAPGRKIETIESSTSIRLRRILQTSSSESRDLLRQVAPASIQC